MGNKKMQGTVAVASIRINHSQSIIIFVTSRKWSFLIYHFSFLI